MTSNEATAKPAKSVADENAATSAYNYLSAATILGIAAVVSWVVAGFLTFKVDETTDFDGAKAIQVWTLAGWGCTAAAIIVIGLGLGLLTAVQNFFERKF